MATPKPGSTIPTLFDAARFDTELAAGADPLTLFRSAIRHGNQVFQLRFESGIDAGALVQGRAQFIDTLVTRAWRHVIPVDDADIALIAVGGYGRGELHPGSDIDLMILLRTGDHDRYRDRLEKFLVFLWDIGLEVGHSVRSLTECESEAAGDITIATNLIESRLLCGPADLFEAMREATGPERIWTSRAFFEAKLKEQIARHHRFHDTGYKLEPNIKESPGGLRDIQMIGWVAKRHFDTDTLQGLVSHGFLTEGEYRSLIEGQAFLWRIRIALHILTGRREDRLLFDYQRTLAERLGYRNDGYHLGVEQFMKRYYRTVTELSRLNEVLLQLFEEAILYADDPGEPVPISRRFQSRKGFLEVVNDGVFRYYPFALLEVFLVMQQHPELKGVRASTIRLIRNHRHLIDDDFRNDLRARSLFMEIMRQPRGITHELRRMNRYGVLAAYIPVFGQIVGQMQYDLFHIYTVDVHTLFLVRNLRRFTVPEFAAEFPRCSQIIETIPKPELLYLAGLFHDIAKGRGGDHSELGAEDANTFCLHHGLSEYDANLVAWLVKNHLKMSTTAQRRDIGDPLVVNEFAQIVGNRVRLDYLYLLTVADIRATNPDLWNSWKDALLMELYTATRRALERGLEHPLDQEEHIIQIKARAGALLAGEGVPREVVDGVWQHFDDDYFLRHTPDQIAWHTRAIARQPAESVLLVDVRDETERGGTEIIIYTRADDHLFALTTALLDQLGLTVADARIITTADGYALDTFVVLDESGEPIQNSWRASEIIETLKRELGRSDRRLTSVTRRTPRLLKHFPLPTQVAFSTDKPNQRTVVEIITADRPGLLSQIGRAFNDCGVRLQNARIGTLGSRAEDVFYVTDSNNRPLKDEAQFDCLHDTLVRYLDGSAPAAEKNLNG